MVSASAPNSNFGTTTTLWVQGGAAPANRAYLKFEPTDLTRRPSRALLRLFAYDGSVSTSHVYRVSNLYGTIMAMWTERGLTWHNAPSVGGSPAASRATVPHGKWVDYDVTAAVTGPAMYSFAVVGTSADSVGFYSRETGAYAPRLVITP